MRTPARARRRRSLRIVVLVTVGASIAVMPAGASVAAPDTGPARVVAGMSDGRVVVMSSTDGRIERVLATADAASAGYGQVTASATTAFFRSVPATSAGTACPRSTIEAVTIAGARRHRVADGREPVVSFDGRRLAYVRRVDVVRGDRRGRPVCDRAVVVRDLPTGHEEVWRLHGRDVVARLSWVGDSRHLLVATAPDTTWAGPLQNRIVDARRGRRLHDVDAMPVPRARRNTTVVLGGLGGRGVRVAAVVGTPGRLVALDGETGRVAATLLASTPASVSASLLPEYDDRGFVSDGSGRHLLWVSEPVRGPDAGRRVAVRLAAGGTPSVLARGVVAATWIPDR